MSLVRIESRCISSNSASNTSCRCVHQNQKWTRRGLSSSNLPRFERKAALTQITIDCSRRNRKWVVCLEIEKNFKNSGILRLCKQCVYYFLSLQNSICGNRQVFKTLKYKSSYHCICYPVNFQTVPRFATSNDGAKIYILQISVLIIKNLISVEDRNHL